MQGTSRLIVLFLAAILVAWCLVSLHTDLKRVSFAPLLSSWHFVLLAMVFTLSNYALRVMRWRLYLQYLGYSHTWIFAALTYVAGFAFTLSPGKLGELFRARYYTERGMPLRNVTAAFFIERIMDVIAISLLSMMILTTFPAYTHVIWVAAVAFTAVLWLLMTLPWARLSRMIAASPKLPHVIARVSGGAVDVLASARVLLRPRSVTAGILIGLGGWTLEGFGLAVLCSTIGPVSLELSLAVGIYSLALLVGAISFLPGGLGSTEAVMIVLLSSQGYPLADALVVTLACRIVTLWFGICMGWIAILALRKRFAQSVVPPAV